MLRKRVVIAFLEVYAYFAYFSIFCLYGISRIWNIDSIYISMMSLVSEHQICQRTNLTSLQM